MEVEEHRSVAIRTCGRRSLKYSNTQAPSQMYALELPSFFCNAEPCNVFAFSPTVLYIDSSLVSQGTWKTRYQKTVSQSPS
ncbi:hypothetical protein M413DRAFT_374665 [Hebeloma cylindrosporum]|uniref:Uncharacterized protein n=1 Tax=Hebeloma cylindrosporum TaxID=76867 RepID=A0A0C2Y2L9_HEBCY|nr:hypothetical protein M413DRAFT_374665 [Hebeloma cylindrosporum h7]